MFSSKSKSKKDFSKRRVKKPGMDLSAGSLGNEVSKRYVGDINTELPEKLRYKKSDQNEHMNSVRPDNYSQKEDSPNKAGEIKLDTGALEIGYDSKNRQNVFSFHYDDLDERSRRVTESSARFVHGYEDDRFRANENNFKTNAVDFRCKSQKPPLMVKREFENLSKEKEYNQKATLDRVLPFNQFESGKGKIEELRKLKSSTNENRSDIHKAITALEVSENKRNQRQLDFTQKFYKAVNELRSEHVGDTTYDYLLYLRKKELLVLQEQSDPEDNNDKNKNKNKNKKKKPEQASNENEEQKKN